MPVSGDDRAAADLARVSRLLAEGATRQALNILDAAVDRNPDDPALAVRRAYALHLAGELEPAIAEYRRALALDAGSFSAWYALGCAELARNGHAAAVRCLRRALRLRQDSSLAHFDLARGLFHLGRVDAAIGHLRRAAAHGDEALRRKALAYVARIIPGSPRSDNAAVLQARRAWAALEAAENPRCAPSPCRPVPGRKLRVGYFSAHFAAPNWMKPVWGALRHHDRSAFEIHLFLDGPAPGAASGYIHDERDIVHPIAGVPNASVAEDVRRIGLDIMVDLSAYSFQDRLGLFMRHPAAVTIGWFNCYATTGIDAFDYLIGDAAVIPTAEEHVYCERVLRVPGSYLAFSVPYPVPDIAAPPCLAAGTITFGCLCSQYKITGDVVAAWARILRDAPNARLLIKNHGLDDARDRAALRKQFSRHGVGPDRLTLEGPADHHLFLRAYDRIDIALDPFPYSGGTTTMEAIWQGVPVLTFNGDRWASRTSRSLLLAARLDAWCTDNLKHYIATAVALARSPETPGKLASLRTTMRDRLAQAPVCDSTGLCGALEQIYRGTLNGGPACR